MKAVDLAPEDALRLNVLLAGELHAVRIDEGAMILYALTPKGEAKISLHRNCRPDLYAMRVRELLGGHALGSPGGYPVHLRRWTRTGHASPKNLAALLKLGEPEAVTAVALAPTLSDELARRAWWALPTMEVARYMLGHAAVRAGAMGPILAGFLIEHLAFEEDPVLAMNSIRAVIGAGLLDAAASEQLWAKARRRPHYYVGFLEHRPDALPAGAELPLSAELQARVAAGDPWALQLARCRAASGQSFLAAAELVLEKPSAHETVYLLLDILGNYFAPLRELEIPADLSAEPGREIEAMAALAHLSNEAAMPILTRTTAIGPLMRRHLEPLFAPIFGHIRVLRGVAR
ncbi:MAG: sulfur reduction protein DsrS [Rhodocyclales bacterium]|nr:sulfur reduction protein DsrS [Rhodocyclales bacterium]